MRFDVLRLMEGFGVKVGTLQHVLEGQSRR